MKGLLLDTHVWIWLMEGSDLLASKHRNTINKAAASNGIYIAAISLWEIGMLANKGRITVEKPILAWIQESLLLPGFGLKPMTPEIAVDSCQLPDDFHGDPADRLIVATARIHSLTLLTHDKKIIDYANREWLTVLPV